MHIIFRKQEDDRKLRPHKTIASIVEKGLCTGCGTCAGICPAGALNMVIDKSKGIYLPRLDEDRCDKCGLCLKVCPGEIVEFPTLNRIFFGKDQGDRLLGHVMRSYTGYASDIDVRHHCSSGGMVSALLIYLLEAGRIDGVLVTRMNKDRPLEPEPFIARTVEEILSAAKSKYCPVPANLALREIVDKEGKYAVVGLPCHIHGIRKSQLMLPKLNERIVYVFGLYCVSNRSFFATENILNKYGINKANIKRLDYRGSDEADAWEPKIVVQFADRDPIVISDYQKMLEFFSQTPYRCRLCGDHTGELADISFGDAWMSQFEGDPLGVSKIHVRSLAGEAVLQQALKDGIISLHPVDNEELKEPSCLKIRRGKFFRKKRALKARLDILCIDGRPIPTYCTEFIRPFLRDYYDAFKEFGTYCGYYNCFLKAAWAAFSAVKLSIEVLRSLFSKSVLKRLEK